MGDLTLDPAVKKVVVVGSGFGGLAVARGLANRRDCRVHLIDRRNFHLFQPLLYQVAMAGLNPSDIAVPIRRLFTKSKNVEITLAEVDQLDLKTQKVHFDDRWVGYDFLIVATGAKHAYFGKEEWESLAPGLKSIEQATEIRRRVLLSFELAEKEVDPARREALLTFVVVGGGPTGVELAGAIAEMASRTLMKDYRKADLRKTRVLLVEAGDRVLAGFPPALSAATERALVKLGVEVHKGVRASNLSTEGLQVGSSLVKSHTLLWAAGVMPSRLAQEIPGPKDVQGRILVQNDLSVEGYRNVFVIGDLAGLRDPEGVFLPGIAPVAIQQGQFVAGLINKELKGGPSSPRPEFRYFNKGMMATIGRSQAVVSMGRLELSGFIAWVIWVFVHIIYLMQFRNRFFVFLQWVWSYFRFGQGARLIVHKTWRFYSGEKISLDH